MFFLSFQAVIAFGVIGACRGAELTNLTTDNVEDNGKEIIVRIPNTKTKQPKLFQIDGYFAGIVREYFRLRPENVPTNRLFVQYRSGKCTRQVMGKNSIANIPKEVAKYLGLPNYKTYTGHGFRRTSTTILANTGANFETLKRHGIWKQNKTCELYIQNSLAYKRKVGALISKAIDLPSTSKVGATGGTGEVPVKVGALISNVMNLPSTSKVGANGGTGEVPAKRRAPLLSTSTDINCQSTSTFAETTKIPQQRKVTSTSIAVGSLSQISVSRDESINDSSHDFGGPSSDDTLVQETLNKYNFRGTRKTLYFTSQVKSRILM